jgi:hypothetical protein
MDSRSTFAGMTKCQNGMAFRPALRWSEDGRHETLLCLVSPAAVVR